MQEDENSGNEEGKTSLFADVVPTVAAEVEKSGREMVCCYSLCIFFRKLICYECIHCCYCF